MRGRKVIMVAGMNEGNISFGQARGCLPLIVAWRVSQLSGCGPNHEEIFPLED